jgi:hypothetical protein
MAGGVCARRAAAALPHSASAVARISDAAAAAVDRLPGNLAPARYGSAVHTDLKKQIDDLKDRDFVAERSFLKGQIDVRYGEKDSVRIDVLENIGNGTVCVYDIKTGDRGLSLLRMNEIAGEVYARYPGTQRIIVTEVRPSR